MNHMNHLITSLFKSRRNLLRLIQVLSLILLLLAGLCLFLSNREAAALPGPNDAATAQGTQPSSGFSTQPSQVEPTASLTETQGAETAPSQQTTASTQQTQSPVQDTTEPSTEPAAPSETTPPPSETTPPSSEATQPPQTSPAPSETTQPPSQSTAPSGESTQPTVPPQTTPEPDPVLSFPVVLDYGLRIDTLGSYTGMYMEDGSDDILSDILMAVVTNTSDTDIQYGELTLSDGSRTARFSLSTLPAGATVVLLEENRMTYSGGTDFTHASVQKVALFSEPLTLMEDMLEIQILDGCVNVTNISGQDIPEDIVIYYKNSVNDMFYGGITYRVRVEGGLKAGELRQIVAGHIYLSGSTILLVTCG